MIHTLQDKQQKKQTASIIRRLGDSGDKHISMYWRTLICVAAFQGFIFVCGASWKLIETCTRPQRFKQGVNTGEQWPEHEAVLLFEIRPSGMVPQSFPLASSSKPVGFIDVMNVQKQTTNRLFLGLRLCKVLATEVIQSNLANKNKWNSTAEQEKGQENDQWPPHHWQEYRTCVGKMLTFHQQVDISTREALASLAQLSVAAFTTETLRNDEYKNTRWPTAIVATSWRKARPICNSCSIIFYRKVFHVVSNAALIAVLQIFQCSHNYNITLNHIFYTSSIFCHEQLQTGRTAEPNLEQCPALALSLSLLFLRIEKKKHGELNLSHLCLKNPRSLVTSCDWKPAWHWVRLRLRHRACTPDTLVDSTETGYTESFLFSKKQTI